MRVICNAFLELMGRCDPAHIEKHCPAMIYGERFCYDKTHYMACSYKCQDGSEVRGGYDNNKQCSSL